MSPAMLKAMTYGLPTMTTLFMWSWPGALQLSFFVSGALSFLQSTAFRQPSIRRWLGITALPEPGSVPVPGAPTPSPYKGKIVLAEPQYQAPNTPTTSASGVSAGKETATKPTGGIFGGAIKEVKGTIQSAKESLGGARKSMEEMVQGKKVEGQRTKAEKATAEAYEKKRQREEAAKKEARRAQRAERLRQ